MPETLPPDLLPLYRFRARFPESVETVAGRRWRVIDTHPGGAAAGTPTLLLLPGTMGTGEIFWQQIEALCGQVRCVAATYPAVPDTRRLADGAVGLLRRRGLRRASVLGSSLGGFVAQTFALRHPEAVETLFIGNSLVRPSVSWIPRQEPAAAVAAKPAGVLQRQRVARTADWPVGDPGLALAQAVIALQGARVMSARHLKARILALLAAEDLPPLPRPPQRTVVIESEDDPVMPPPVRREVRERYPDAAVHTLPSGGHFPYISRPEAYTAILRRHLPTTSG